MNYDIKLYKPGAEKYPHVAARANPPASPPDPGAEALTRKVADALVAHNPGFKIFHFEYGQIAKPRTAPTAHRRGLELNLPVGGDGNIRIKLFDHEACLSVPFSLEGERAAAAFREVWACLEIICRNPGWLVYDQQTGRVFAPSSDFGNALACYTGIVRQLRRVAPVNGLARKPWWALWWRKPAPASVQPQLPTGNTSHDLRDRSFSWEQPLFSKYVAVATHPVSQQMK